MSKESNEIFQTILLIIQKKVRISYPENEQLAQEITDKINIIAQKADKKRKSLIAIYSITLTTLLILFLTISYILFFKIIPNSQKLQTDNANIQSFNINNTIIHLNANSKIKLRQYQNGKTIQLINGEIFIQNPKNEYIEIFTKDKVITFFKGNMSVVSKNDYFKAVSDNTNSIVQSNNKTFNLQPNHQYSHFKNNDTITHLSQPGNVGMFRVGFLYYNNDPISYILKDLEDIYNINIQFKSLPPPDTLKKTAIFPIEKKPIEIIQYLLEQCIVEEINTNTISINCSLNLPKGDINDK